MAFDPTRTWAGIFDGRPHTPRLYQPVAKVITAFDRPCIPADGVAIRAHTPGMHPNRALSGGRRNGLGARGTFTTDCYRTFRPPAEPPVASVTRNSNE